MIKLLRLLRGFAVVMVSGSFPEKFVNILTYHGINVWNVKSRDGVVYFRTIAANYKYIRKLSHRTNNKIRIVSKHGLPFFINRNKSRMGLAVGSICFILIFKVLSMFLWNIDIYGNNRISYNNAKKVMNDVGIYEGAFCSFPSLKNIQTDAMIKFGNVSWITVNIDGSKGDVNISEVTERDDIQNETHYNIKAACDGQIIRIDTYSGSAAVNSGDAVAKGNLLISGFVESELGGTNLSTADGLVWAKTNYSDEFVFPKHTSITKYSPTPSNRISCRLFGIVIPLKLDYYDTSKELLSFIAEQKASFQGETASVSLINENIYCLDNSNIDINEPNAQKLLKTEMLLNELFNYNNKKITGRTINYSADDKSYYYTVNYSCEEDIGVKSEIILDDNFSIQNQTNIED